MSTQKRDISADIIRCFALFCVVSVHFFLHIGFYTQMTEGKRMLIMHMMRALSMLTVPLFLTLSGYLLNKKELSVKYYKRVIPLLSTYVMACLVCLAYAIFFLGHTYTASSAILAILDFVAAPYAWYVEMYLGLFLMIPFLNLIYNNIPTQKWKLVLVASFIVLTILPSTFNEFNIEYIEWWRYPALSTLPTNQLIPAYWVRFYPVTYYFLGCYLKEYGFKINKVLNVLLILVCVVLGGLYTFWRSYKSNFVLGEWAQEYSVVNVVLTTLIFTFFTNLKYDKVPAFLAKFIQKLSGLCYGAYLVSWVFDDYFYTKLVEKVPDMILRLDYFFIIVPMVFVLSLITSYLISKVIWVLTALIGLVGKIPLFKKA